MKRPYWRSASAVVLVSSGIQEPAVFWSILKLVSMVKEPVALVAGVLGISMYFVYRSFYGMRIQVDKSHS